MPFDPDKYLAAASAFNPDAYLAKASSEAPSFLGQLGRQVGLTARHGLEGVGGALDTLASPLRAGVNALLPDSAQMTPGTGERIANTLGLPSPANPTERIAGDIVRNMAGMAGVGGGAGLLARGASAGAQPILSMLSASPGQQAMSAAGAGAAGGVARESGAGPGAQTAAALAGGMATPMVANAGGRFASEMGNVAGAAWNDPTSVKNLAQAAVQKLAGDSKGKQIGALLNATEYAPGVKPTVAEAIAEANMGQPTQFGGGTIKMQKDLSGASGMEDVLPSAARAQNAAMEKYLANMKAETAPMRETALANANVANEAVPQFNSVLANKQRALANVLQSQGKLATQATGGGEAWTDATGTLRHDFPYTPVPGMPRVPSNMSPLAADSAKGAEDAAAIAAQLRAEKQFTQNKLDSVSAHGYQELKPGPLIDNISSTLNVPGTRASKVVQKTLADVKERIANQVDSNGNIHPADLYVIRKEVGNTVEMFSKEHANWDKKWTAGIEKGIQQNIDAAIENAGGTGWTDYLAKYSSGMKASENQAARLEEAANIAKTVKSSSGVLEAGQIPQAPTLLSRPMMLANWILSHAKRDANAPVAQMVAKAMTDPQEYAKLLMASQPTAPAALDTGSRAALAAALYSQQGAQ